MVDRVIEDVAIAIAILWICETRSYAIRRNEPTEVGVVITGIIVRQLTR